MQWELPKYFIPSLIVQFTFTELKIFKQNIMLVRVTAFQSDVESADDVTIGLS